MRVLENWTKGTRKRRTKKEEKNQVAFDFIKNRIFKVFVKMYVVFNQKYFNGTKKILVKDIDGLVEFCLFTYVVKHPVPRVKKVSPFFKNHLFLLS